MDVKLKNESLCCDNCKGDDFAFIKKGFSGRNAVIGFLAGIMLSSLFFENLFNVSQPGIFYTYGMVIILPILGILYGTVKMNSLYKICIKCGDSTELNTKTMKR